MEAKQLFAFIKTTGGYHMKKLLGNISTAALILLSIHSAAYAFHLPDTGQTKCYGTVSPYNEIDCSGTGQDGEYNINPMSYTDNGNGTVTDNNTGLIWQKCSMGQDSMTCSGTALTYTWDQAPAATGCGALNTANLAGHNDWRVPSKKELISIVDYSVPFPGPTIKVKYFPNTIAGSASLYWTSTQLASAATSAWYTSFDYGSVYNVSKSTSYYVRCVRGGATARSFTPNGNTVTDNRTGLTWQKCAPGQNDTTCLGTATRYNWNDALSYCNNLSLANQTDWRIPSAKEFESLTDDTKFNPSIDTTNFPHTVYDRYWWSSTTSASSPNYAWYAAFGGGSVVSSGDKDPLGNLNVRCVRGGQNGVPNYLVRLMDPDNPVKTYSTLHDAYAAAYEGYMIQAQATDLTETLTLADNKAVTLRGGYDSDFSLHLSMTNLIGSLTITGGTLTVENLIIE
jgi:hypothetical protein